MLQRGAVIVEEPSATTTERLSSGKGTGEACIEPPEWWSTLWEHVEEQARAAKHKWAAWERWQRRLARQRPLEVDSDYPRGITARFHCQQEPVDAFRPIRRQEHEVGLFASWLNAEGDGVTTDFVAGSLFGQQAVLTAGVALDAQRHSLAEATLQGGSRDPPSVKLEYECRQHNLLLGRRVVHQASAAYDASDRACQLSSSTSVRCRADRLQLTAMAGTDLTHTDVGVELLLVPAAGTASGGAPVCTSLPPGMPPLPGGSGAGGASAEAPGLRRAQLSAVTSLDGIGKQLALETSHRISASGAVVDVHLESREEAALGGLLRPEGWSTQLSAPLLHGAKTLCVSLRRGAAAAAPSFSARLTPGGNSVGGLAVGLSRDLSRGASPTLEAEWHLGTEEGWVTDGTPTVTLSAEVCGGWSGSRANFDVLVPH